MKIKPTNDRVVVEITAAETKTAGGILLPEQAQEKQSKGTVIAVGPGKLDETGRLVPMDVVVGDVVLFGKYGGSELKMDNKDYKVMRESELLAKVNK